MAIDIKIIEEIKRYNQINNYITEQELPPPPVGGEVPPAEGEVPAPAGEEMVPPAEAGVAPAAPAPPAEPQPVDVANDPDVEKLDDKEEKTEIEVTDLVKSQKSVEQKQEDYFESLFDHLKDLEDKLSAMDSIIDKLNTLETKIEKYKVKTPEEKLELRTLDSGPFNQKLSQYFEDKEGDFEATGKEQYIITPDDVESYSANEIKNSFRNFNDTEMTKENDISGFKKIY